MPTSFINDPEHWRNRAERARSLADQMNDEAFKQMMLRTVLHHVIVVVGPSPETAHGRRELEDQWGHGSGRVGRKLSYSARWR
jgi:hypothetical protein